MIVGRAVRVMLAMFVCTVCALLPITNASAATCPNDASRTGPSASLPDCRAYELVTPPDTNGRYLGGISTFGFAPPHDVFPTELLARPGDSLIYTSYTSGLRQPWGANGMIDVYEAERSPSGWSTTRRLSPSGSEAMAHPDPGGVSPDHQFTFSTINNAVGIPSGSLGSGGVAEYLGRSDGSFELVGSGSLGTERFAQGRFISSGGQHIIFTTGSDLRQSILCFGAGKKCPVAKIEESAPPAGTGAIYDRNAFGKTHVVSLLPPNVPQATGQQAFYRGVSKDASSIAFMIEGVLYVRINNGEEGEETVKAAEGEPVYGGLSDDGRYLFYVAGGEKGIIHRFDTITKADVEVNPTAAAEMVNVSADGSHVYFIAEEEIGGQGKAGKPNLYVWSGALKYVATVAVSDLERTSGVINGQCSNYGATSSFACGIPALTRWTNYAVTPPSEYEPGPGADSSRSTPDGQALLFESRAQLTSYDNAGHTEIYLFNEASESLRCLSCRLTQEPAQHDAHLEQLRMLKPGMVIHNLSEAANRAFFETAEPLVPADTDGVNDIYEWTEEEGGGTSIALISSGESTEYIPNPTLPLDQSFNLPSPNMLFSVTPSGDDVAFLSQDTLSPGAGEGGVPAIYDARVEGGFPQPEAPKICLEEGCRPPPSSEVPTFGEAQSEATKGFGNLKPRKARCRRHSKHRKKRQCRGQKSKKRGARISSSAAPYSVQVQGDEQRIPFPSSLSNPGTSNAFPVSGATLSGGEFESFGIESVGANLSTPAAGVHPDFTIEISMNHHFYEGRPVADAMVEDVAVSLPPGLIGNPAAFPRCSTGSFIAINCEVESQVGFVRKVLVQGFPGEYESPIYNLEPAHPKDEVARLGFIAANIPIFIDVKARTAGDYGVSATVHSAPGAAPLIKTKTTLWGDPADSSHDGERVPPGESSLAPTAFMTNPSACQGGEVKFAITSYQLPGQIFEDSAPLSPITDCQGLPFAPTFEAEPTSHAAGAPTGLKTKLILPQHLEADERATSTMREARVTLPAGMQVAAGAANWIGTCSDEQVGFHEEVDAACPDNSKLGTATITSPVLSEPLEGTVYQRAPRPGHQLGLWLTSDVLGLHIKIPGDLEPDPNTGRLTAVFRDLPQVPVEEIDLDVWGGSRAPLQNPDHCGTYTTDYSFAPHSEDPVVSGQSQMQITEGCNQGFSPTLHAGVTEPVAGRFSPLVIDLAREDGQQQLRGFELELPDGELAQLKGVPLCPDGAALSGNCPAGSAIGHVVAATGPGPEPLWVPQPGKAEPRIYLAGPYQGSPFSVVTEVPAQAGPFDLGTVVVRSGLGLDPDTNRPVVKADPLPQFFEGVGLTYRRLHVVVDRPEFSLNPTDCSEMQVDSNVTSTLSTVAHPAARFQVDGCKALKFKPKLSLKLKGGTKRGDYPALTAILKARKGDANIAKTSVGLPHSEFLAQEHIVTICTRKQFAADKCPKGSVYGRAKAWTPLLAKPLEGPVYLRSSSHPLPDMVVALGGELNVTLVGRIDSHKGGIRSTFAAVPDAPVTKFVLKMRGGRKSLLVNSADICQQTHRAQVVMRAQNGRALVSKSTLSASACGNRTK